MKKNNELFQFLFEDFKGLIGFTDFGTKEQMAALYADAMLRMERFCEKCKDNKVICLNRSGKENGGEWSTYNWNGNVIYVRYEKVPTFNSSSHKELRKEMNFVYNNY